MFDEWPPGCIRMSIKSKRVAKLHHLCNTTMSNNYLIYYIAYAHWKLQISIGITNNVTYDLHLLSHISGVICLICCNKHDRICTGCYGSAYYISWTPRYSFLLWCDINLFVNIRNENLFDNTKNVGWMPTVNYVFKHLMIIWNMCVDV